MAARSSSPYFAACAAAQAAVEARGFGVALYNDQQALHAARYPQLGSRDKGHAAATSMGRYSMRAKQYFLGLLWAAGLQRAQVGESCLLPGWRLSG